MVHGRLTLTVPAGALNEPTTISLRDVPKVPRGAAGPAWELGPDGLAFATPATLELSFDPDGLPPGTDPGGLRLCVRENGRWVPLPDQVHRRVERRLVAPIRHFSTYGIVPEPRAVSATGTRFAANGVVVETSAPVLGRLFVSPTNVSFYAERDSAVVVAATFTGLPVDAEHHAYVNSYSEARLLRPEDGGRLRVDLDLSERIVVWVQPQPGTWRIAAPPMGGDECAAVGGLRTGDVCTLTRDVEGSVELASGVLDCAGHRIAQPPSPPEAQQTGIGVFVGPNAVAPEVRRCAVGASGQGFAQGIYVLANGAAIKDSTFDDNLIGVLVQGGSGARIQRNRFRGDSLWAVAIWDTSVGASIGENEFDVEADAIAIEGPANLPAANHDHEVRGNVVTRATGGILLAATRENRVTGNDVSGVLTALLLGPNALPNRVWWNDFHGWSRWGVWSDAGPVELSDGGRGNWWGSNCPGPLFVPSVTSSRTDVVDSFPYGSRSGWTAGEAPNCGGRPNIPICPEDGSAGIHDVVWDSYTPRSPVVAAAWERLRDQIQRNESAHDSSVRAEWAARGLFLKDKPPVPPIVLWNRDTDNPRVIAGRITEPSTFDAHAVARGFLRDFGDLFSGRRAPGALTDLRLENIVRTSLHTTFTFRQYYRGVPIVNAPMTLVVAADGALVFVSGHYYPDVSADLSGICSRETARRTVREEFAARWPDPGRLDVRADLALYAWSGREGMRFFPAWVGHVRRFQPLRGIPDAFFILNAADCTVARFGERRAESDVLGAATVSTPSPSFAGFGSAPPPDWTWYQVWVDDGLPAQMTCSGNWGSVNHVWAYRFRPGTGEVPTTSDACSVPAFPDPAVVPAGATGPCWYYLPQEPVSALRLAGCFPNPGTPACDAMYSAVEATTAYARIQDGMRWFRRLDLGFEGGRLPFSWALDVAVHDPGRSPSEPGLYTIRVLDPHEISLYPFQSVSVSGISVIDHEWHHDMIYKFLKARGVTEVCCGVAFDDDDGQSEGLEEVLPEFFADARNRQDAGVQYRSFPASTAPPSTPPTAFHPSHGLGRADCMPRPGTECPRPNTIEEPCMRVIPANGCDDNYTWLPPLDEEGDRDGHANNNGRVLYQALTDFRERFGSYRFGPGSGYAGPTIPVRFLGPSGVSGAVQMDWGASHELDPASAGMIGCRDVCTGGVTPVCYRHWSQWAHIEEHGFGEPPDAIGGNRGRMSVSFESISLPVGARLTVGTLDPLVTGPLGPASFLPGAVTVGGPLEYEFARDGPLLSSYASPPRIDVVAMRSLPAGTPCPTEPLFRIRGWRHTGGMIPERLVAQAVWWSNAWIDWYVFRTLVFAADRSLYGAGALGHQGTYYQLAFDNHGVDSTLGWWCGECPCSCHDHWYCPLVRLFAGC